MDSGYYAACSALVTRMRALDTIANNLANVNTVGFRAEHNEFSSVMASQSADADNPLNQAINDFGVFGGVTVDQTQGSLQKTGNPLDLAIQGGGYFAVQTSNGVMYTRNGSFSVSGKGQLETSNGDLVLGEGGNPITMVPGKIAISANGTISTNGAVTGKLKIVEFPEGTQITSVGNTYYSAPQGKDQEAANSDVRQGMLENSNVNPITGMVELVMAQRSAESMQRALAMFNTEMDKIASQDIAKVS